MTAHQSPPGSPGGGAAPFGAAPGDDSASMAELTTFALTEGRGYERATVDAFRRKALNSLERLEHQVAQLRVDNETMRQRMTAPLSPESISRGLSRLALEMRDLIGEQDPAVRQWYASELSAIVGANDRELAADCAARLPMLLAEALKGEVGERHATVEWLEKLFWSERMEG